MADFNGEVDQKTDEDILNKDKFGLEERDTRGEMEICSA